MADKECGYSELQAEVLGGLATAVVMFIDSILNFPSSIHFALELYLLLLTL